MPPDNQPPQTGSGEYYISPHSAAQLRFPPSPRYAEWKGRCFRCCRMGHSAARCQNLRRCGRCWGQGHVGSFCKNKGLNLVDTPRVDQTRVDQPNPSVRRGEPDFAELFHNSLPVIELPVDRPNKIVCFIERDEQYYEERAKLDNMVIMYNPLLEVDLSIEEVAKYAASSGVVKAEEVSIGIMTKSRYAIQLPLGVEPVKFIRAIPVTVWEEGYSFSLWSPLDDATVEIPRYKVMMDLIGIPPDLYRERNVIRAVGAIGTYLGTVEQTREGDIACWTVVIATSSLSLIPSQVEYRVGGMKYNVDVIPKACSEGDLYGADEIPKPREKFLPPTPQPASSFSSEESVLDKDDHFIGSRRVLEELCQNIPFDELPLGIQAVLRGATTMEVQQGQGIGDGSSHEKVTKNPDVQEHIQGSTVEATENHSSIPMAQSATTEVLGTNLGESMSPTLEDVSRNQEQRDIGLLNPIQQGPIEKEVAGSFNLTQVPGTQETARNMPEKTSVSHNNSVINIPVLSFPITAVSPKEKGNFLIGEHSKNHPRILQRIKSTAINISSLFDEAENEASKEGHGPKLCEPTRIEKKRLLQESTKQKRKLRKQAKGKVRATSSSLKPKASLINEGGLVSVHVDFEHCSRIAEVTGFQNSQVAAALAEDNAQRNQNSWQSEEIDPIYETEEEPFVFESGPNEEVDSELE